MSSNWNEYWGIEADKEYWHRPAAAIVDVITQLSNSEYNRVLDLGCGIGRHALAFAKAGFSVTAVDASPNALMELSKSADSLGVNIIAREGSFSEQLFPAQSFDLVISYNVIYHGCYGDFAQAVRFCKDYLRLGGLFFFTCPSREDGKYGNGDEVAPHTYRSENSVHPGDIHYFADQDDIHRLTEGLELISLKKQEHYWDNDGTQQFSSSWEVCVKKPC